MATEKSKPVYDKRLGNIRLAIWENNTNGKTWFNVAVTRRYREGEEWKDATSFSGLADLAVVQQAVSLAMDWIVVREDDVQTGEVDHAE
jgi:hypothetical protein